MEKRQAIEFLEYLRQDRNLERTIYRDALNMAIDALKAQLSSEGTTKDAISRQAAIDIFDDYNVSVENGDLEAYSRDRKRLCELPTVQPEVLACGNGELVAKPEPTDIDAREAVYNLAEKIGIHQLYALAVELRGEPIQPEPHEGHWIWVAGDLECSKCHTRYPDLYPDYDNSVACPHCGYKMEVEHDSDLHAE